MAIIRFFRGGLLLGSAEVEDEDFIVDVADKIGITIPTNCTSGNCGTCIVRLISGDIEYPDPLPPGLDEFLVELVKLNFVIFPLFETYILQLGNLFHTCHLFL